MRIEDGHPARIYSGILGTGCVKAPRFKAALERWCLTDPEALQIYIRVCVNRRWPEAEEIIKQHPGCLVDYIALVMRRRVPEWEPFIMASPWECYCYALLVIKGPWREAEEVMRSSEEAWDAYNRLILRHYSGAKPQ